MTPFGDRRSHLRLEVVGSLWSGLDISEEARIVNIGRGGALVESRIPAVVDSTRTIKLRIDGDEIQIEVRILHLRRVTWGASCPIYQMGLEFLEAPGAFLSAFD